MTPVEAWLATLDELRASAAALEAASSAESEQDRVEVAVWQPPADLGPLPPELAERARAVLARLEEAVATATARHAVLSKEFGDLDRRRQAGTAYQHQAARGG